MADISEREAWNGLVDAFKRMRDYSRALALLRSDQRWLGIARIAESLEDNCKKLFTKSARQGNAAVVTPPGQALDLSRPGSGLLLPPGVRRGN